jgi:cysteinyl-tRNA synthetase
MGVRLYNTLTQRVEDLEPLEPGKVRVYVCGITTYDNAHAGHARTYTSFDVLVRFLALRGYEVIHVRNVTDVDDKILKRASELGEEPLSFSRRMSEVCNADLDAIGCAHPNHEPRVSTHIAEIVALIERLIAKGHAYVAETPKGKDVYFAVRSFAPYGKLSHRNIDDLQAGARIEVGEIKRDPLDFALWKGDEAPGAWGFSSPWGKGRPGWHIECSAMSHKYLGEHFDIHCGGMDLVFPHHENEIAQSEAVHGPPMAKLWMHGGFLEVDKEKMSKSLGNFVTVKDVLARNDAEGLRYFMLGTHYRGPLSFDVEKDGDRVRFPGVDDAERHAGQTVERRPRSRPRRTAPRRARRARRCRTPRASSARRPRRCSPRSTTISIRRRRSPSSRSSPRPRTTSRRRPTRRRRSPRARPICARSRRPRSARRRSRVRRANSSGEACMSPSGAHARATPCAARPRRGADRRRGRRAQRRARGEGFRQGRRDPQGARRQGRRGPRRRDRLDVARAGLTRS